MKYWLVKSEPSAYSWQQLLKDKKTSWTGIRSYAARLNINAMKKDDLLFFYHSNEGLSIVGIAKVIRESYPDPDDKKWTAVDIVSVESLKNPVTLTQIKENKKLANMALVKIGRLSVSPVTKSEYEIIVKLSQG